MDALMSFEEALDSVHLTPDRVDIVIQTHLHFDHCFNTRKCTNARVLVQRAELEFARNPAPFHGMYREDLLDGVKVEAVDGDFQLFDGIDLLLVPGHSAGGQAVSVQTEKGRVVISGLCGIQENFFPKSPHPMAGSDNLLLPGIMLDAVAAYKSLLRIKRTADIILPLHDPEILNVKQIP
jgi:N-acyl homoserine lactone hydrolase